MSVAVCLAVVVGVTAAEARQAPVLAAATLNGNDVTFNWSGTAGATGYRLDGGFSSGVYIGSLPVGNVTTYSIGLPNGVYFARIVALTGGGEVASNEIIVQVPAPPSAPTGLTVARNGTGLVAVWTPGGGGGSPLGYRLYASLSPAGAPLAVLTSAIPSWGVAGGVPPGLYYLRVTAVNAVGESAFSNEVAVVMSVGGDCDAPPTPTLTTSAWGPILSASWTPIAGASSYLFNFAGPGGQGQVPFGGNQNRFSARGISFGTWQFSVQAVFACGRAGNAGASTLVVDNTSLKMEPRVPDPAPGTALPVPAYARDVVFQVAAQYRGDLLRSCSNNIWLFRLVEELRKRDKRWGLNWKRANIGDMSTDILTYNWGDQPDEGTPKMRAWDVIAGHCGPNPGPNFDEKTDPAPPDYNGPEKNGRPYSALWTLIPYIEAGFIP
jgi:hypothetical protein